MTETNENPEVPLGGKPLEFALTPTQAADYKVIIFRWLAAQGAVVVVLCAWLTYNIYDGWRKDSLIVTAADKRAAFDKDLWEKIDKRLTELSIADIEARKEQAAMYAASLKEVTNSFEKATERYERRIDAILDRAKEK